MTVDLKARGERRPREQRAESPWAGTLELRDASSTSSGNPQLVGYACVTERSYTIQDWLGPYEEVVRAGAFAKTLSEQDDVRLLLNHEGMALARTKSGTLQLREVVDPLQDPQGKGQTGLWCEADLDPESGLVRDVQSAMKRGDMDEMSFAFQVLKQRWSPDFTERDIQEVKLFDVSLVTYPANPATSANLRSLLSAKVDEQTAGLILRDLRVDGAELRKEHRELLAELMEMVAGRSASQDQDEPGYDLAMARAVVDAAILNRHN